MLDTFTTLVPSIPFLGEYHRYVTAFFLFVALWILLKLFELVCLLRLQSFAKKTETVIDDILIQSIKALGPRFYGAISLLIAGRYAHVGDAVVKWGSIILGLVIALEVMKAISTLIDGAIDLFVVKFKESAENKKHVASMFRMVKRGVLALLWVLLGILLLANLGVDVTSLIASLGIGGLAIALALKNVLSDMFSSISIYLDKPFRVGDFISVGNHSGTVKRIGMKSTRLETLRGEELVITNRELTDARIQNFKKLTERRDEIVFSVPYELSRKQIESIPDIVANLFKGKEETTSFLRCHLHQLLPDGLGFELVYTVNSKLHDDYMNERQGILLDLHSAFAKKNIEFVYPTRVVKLEK